MGETAGGVKPPLCRHCQARPAWRPRGLCWSCWHVMAIRQLYPPSKHAPLRLDGETMADLDRMEAEQRECLPAWWSADVAAATRREYQLRQRTPRSKKTGRRKGSG